MSYPTLLAGAFVALGVLSAAHPARAETYHTCAGFIDSVPATITTQGVWCLRKDLSTNITSGNAITIATNNVTIDCNGFKLGGLAAGNASEANGIYAFNRQNATVRHCSVRGFWYGIDLASGAGHLVEDNRLDNNLQMGIYVAGDNNRVHRNAVYDTGGWTGGAYVFGIRAAGDIVDNTVSGVFADVANGNLIGISAFSSGTQVRGNTVSGFVTTAIQGGAVGDTYGIILSAPRLRASDNHVSGNGGTNGYGIFAMSTSNFCVSNTVSGFTTNIHSTCTQSGNLTAP